MGILLFEVVRKCEGNYWQTGIIVRASLAILTLIVLSLLVLSLPFRTMDIADATVPAGGLQRLGQQSSIGQSVLHDCAVALEPQVDEVVVLSNDLCSWSGEVEGVRLLSPPEIMQFEHQKFWEE